MTEAITTYINTLMKNANLNYALWQWNDDIVYPYWIGEGEETEPTDEDQWHTYTFRLVGTTRGTYASLEKEKRIIENIFNSHTTTLEDNSAVVFSYVGARITPTGDGELKRMTINIRIEEMRVN